MLPEQHFWQTRRRRRTSAWSCKETINAFLLCWKQVGLNLDYASFVLVMDDLTGYHMLFPKAWLYISHNSRHLNTQILSSDSHKSSFWPQWIITGSNACVCFLLAATSFCCLSRIAFFCCKILCVYVICLFCFQERYGTIGAAVVLRRFTLGIAALFLRGWWRDGMHIFVWCNSNHGAVLFKKFSCFHTFLTWRVHTEDYPLIQCTTPTVFLCWKPRNCIVIPCDMWWLWQGTTIIF